jgi:hypothetical protein
VGIKKKQKSKKPVLAGKQYADDTPRNFSKLMTFAQTGKGPRSGLDDGTKVKANRGTKRKRNENGDEPPKEQSKSKQVAEVGSEPARAELKRQPGERLGDFSARVNQALPISGLVTKGKKVEGVKEKRTKHDKRLLKMQSQWREDDVKIREKEEEEQEIAEGEWEEKLAGLDKDAREAMINFGKAGSKKKKKRAKLIGEVDDDDDDPWAQLNQKREAPKGIFDVVQEPPRFEKIPREIFKGVKVHDVPKEAGSLRRRVELGQTRAEIIKSYRSMMASKRS